MDEAGGKRAKSRNIRPLGRLLPFLGRHKMDAAIATVWLIGSTVASLALTATARGAIDQGFENGGANIDKWFLILGLNAVVLGLATALRYFYVTKTGERMIADLRTALFQRILTLDPVFFAHMLSLIHI